MDGEGIGCRGLAAFVLVAKGSYVDFVEADLKVHLRAPVQSHYFSQSHCIGEDMVHMLGQIALKLCLQVAAKGGLCLGGDLAPRGKLYGRIYTSSRGAVRSC